MKLALKEFDYTHLKYLTYAENTNQTIEGTVALYPHTITKSSDAVIGTLKQIATQREGALASDDYIEIPQNEWIELGFRNADNIIGQIGEFSSLSPTTTAALGISHAGESATSKYELYFQHPVGLQYYISPSDRTPNTTPTFLSAGVGIGSGFSFPLYMESKIRITNNSTSAEWIRIYDLYFVIYNTVKSGVQTKNIWARYSRYGGRDPENKVRIIFLQDKGARILLSSEQKDIVWDGNNITGTGNGRPFDSWIDEGTRSNGYAEAALIRSPTYIKESLLRDENFVERDLTLTVGTTYEVEDLASDEDDYYNGAIWYNVTTNHRSVISDYDGTGKTLTLATADGLQQAGDNCYITNIQGDNKIDLTSFDALGNTTNGTRKDWRFAVVYDNKRNIRDMLDELCFASHTELVESINPDTGINLYKTIAIDSGTGDTWTNPAYLGGLELMKAELTPLDTVFSQFKLRYHYDYGSGDYTKEMYVDRFGFPDGSTILSATEQGLCENAETNYKIRKLFTHESRLIYDNATAERFIQKKLLWFTKQRLIVTYVTPIVGDLDWIKYEIGDQVKLNFVKGIPTGLNNFTYFMIMGKKITPAIGGGQIEWQLIQLL